MPWMLLLLVLLPQIVLAWGNLGHQTICQMTLEELTPTARAEVERLIALDSNFDSFADACTFADHPRRRPSGHFINLPRSATAVTTDNCPMANDCLFKALADDLAILSDKTRSDAERLFALKLMGHWVGDFHQPLHISFADDRGGNSVLERGGPCDNNLHSTWDTCIIAENIGTDFNQNAALLDAEISSAERDHWRFDSPMEWANESFQITTAADVEYCIRQQGACWYSANNMMLQDNEPRRTVTVNQTYLSAHTDVVKTRLKQSSVRLGALLNAVLQ